MDPIERAKFQDLRLKVAELEKKVEALEKDSHPPFDFSNLVNRLKILEHVLNVRNV